MIKQLLRFQHHILRRFCHNANIYLAIATSTLFVVVIFSKCAASAVKAVYEMSLTPYVEQSHAQLLISYCKSMLSPFLEAFPWTLLG